MAPNSSPRSHGLVEPIVAPSAGASALSSSGIGTRRSKWDSFTDNEAGEGKGEATSDHEGGEEKKEAQEGNIDAFFQKLYADADDDTRRAMQKSFVESGGTALSTNWKDVGAKQTQVVPPKGMEARKYDQ